jgi:hypothetical protein
MGEYSDIVRSRVDGLAGAGSFDEYVAEIETASLEYELDPEAKAELEAESERLEEVLSRVVGLFAEIHTAGHAEDHSYVTYATGVVTSFLRLSDDRTRSALLYLALDTLGAYTAHAADPHLGSEE